MTRQTPEKIMIWWWMYEMYAKPFNSFLTKNNIELKIPKHGLLAWLLWDLRDSRQKIISHKYQGLS